MAPARTHLVVLGATGFTGRFVVDEVVRRLPALRAAVPGFTWAIAGRSRGSLDGIVAAIRKTAPEVKTLPSIVEADVKNVESLKHMAQGTHLVLNCVGPYALLGEPVVQAVIEASEALAKQGQAPVDYADLTGEPGFIELMVLKYYERALAAGCTLVHAAAFDSVPADMGVLFASEALRKRGATPASIEIFVTVHTKDGQRMGGNYGTYASAINGFATRAQLSKTRKQLYGPMLPKTTPVAKQRGLGLGLPRRKGRFGVLWAEEVKSYLVPFFFADPAVIRLSQSLTQLQAEKAGGALPESVQIVAWMQLPSLYVLLIAAVLMTFFGLFASSARGRQVLQAHPKLFSGGIFSFEGPSQAQIEATSFETTMVARGHSASLLKGAKEGSGIGTDVSATIKIKGVEPGYRATPALFVAVARTMLAERSKVKKGVLVPGAALSDTRLIDDLNEDGRVTFSVQE